MTVWERAKVAAVVCVTIVGVGAVFEIVFSVGIGKFVFSSGFVVLILVLAYILAPQIASRVRYK